MAVRALLASAAGCSGSSLRDVAARRAAAAAATKASSEAQIKFQLLLPYLSEPLFCSIDCTLLLGHVAF